MKKIPFLAMLFISAISFAQFEITSFEEPEAIGGQYTDLGDPAIAHDLINNDGEPIINYTSIGGELGFSASYVPYDTPGVGLTDGDFVGVTTFAPTGNDPFPDGEKGYEISDVDGNFILEFDEVEFLDWPGHVYLNYFIADEGFEGDGTENESGSDRIRIYVKDLTNNTEIDILNSTGSDINDLELQGTWQDGEMDLDSNAIYQLVIEVRCNSANEAFFFDNIHFEGILGLDENNKELFSLYPNPAYDYLTITSKLNGEKNIVVYTILGKQVINKTIANERLDISMLPSGVYIVKVTQEGNSSTKKMVIK